MKYNKITLVFFILLLSSISYSQHVIHRHSDHILLNIDQSSGYRIDHIYNMYRSVNDTTVLIGKAQIIEFRDSKCAMKIISENQPIKIGDFIESTDTKKIDNLFGSYYKKINVPEHTRNRTITYIAAGTGVVATIMGYSFYRQSAKAYDEYKSADTADDTVYLFNEAERWDNLSKVSYGIGGGLLVFALINELINPASDQEKMVTVNPNFINRSVTLAINF
ncbi:MAG: hypothetical protein R6V04_06020 [bacterium]